MDLFIQKISACCSKKLMNDFQNHLKENNHLLPKKFIDVIIKNPNETIDFYSTAVYGDSKNDSIKKLNQLSHHTLKLFSFITQNFPSFLWHNLSEIEILLIENKSNDAINKLKLLIDVADKVEDFAFLHQLSIISKQHQYTFKSVSTPLTSIGYLNLLLELENVIKLQEEIIQKNIETKYSPTQAELNYFQNLFNSKYRTIQIISKQSYLNVISSCNHKLFYTSTTLELIKSTIKQSENYAYLNISKLKEKFMSLDYMLVKHTRLILNEKDVSKICSKIISKWHNIYKSDSLLHKGLMLALGIKGSYLITNYYFAKINSKLTVELTEIIGLCRSIQANNNWEIEGYISYINFCNIYSTFLILNNEAEEAIRLIEKILHEFQQKSFKKLYDGLFVILIMAYIKAKKYDQVISSFVRYKKLTKASKNVTIEENDLVINALYYIAQIKENNKDLYHKKLKEVKGKLEKNPLLIDNYKLIERTSNSLL